MKSLRLIAVLLISLTAFSCGETRTDNQIDNEIEAALDSRNLTKVDADVENGVATLKGEVTNEADKAAAESAARAVAGVQSVVNNIEVKAEPVASAEGVDLDTYAETPDGWITFKTKLALFADGRTSAYDTEVTTVDGKVVLSGKVETEQAKSAATQVTRKIDGVKNVENNLQVVPEAKREVVDDKDDAVKQRVSDALSASGLEAGSTNFNVEVANGVVTLHGEAKTRAALSKAVRTAARVPGVKAVKSSTVRIGEKPVKRVSYPTTPGY